MRALILIGLLLLSGCSFCIEGSGKLVTKDDYVVSYFDSVDLHGSADIFIKQGKSNSLKVVAEDNVIGNLKFDIDKQTLTITQKSCVHSLHGVKIYLVMNDVKKVGVSGSGDVFTENTVSSPDLTLALSGDGSFDMDLDVDDLETMISGLGDVTLRGVADRHTYSVSGSGELNAFDLKTAYTTIAISGSADAEVDAEQELDVKISGSGDVLYHGDPMVDSAISGSGSVEKE